MRALHLVSRDTEASPTGKSHQLQEDLIGRQAATDEYPKVVAEGLGNLFSQVRVPKLGQQRCNQSSLPATNSQQCRRVRGKTSLPSLCSNGALVGRRLGSALSTPSMRG